jgi:hypothetical protein
MNGGSTHDMRNGNATRVKNVYSGTNGTGYVSPPKENVIYRLPGALGYRWMRYALSRWSQERRRHVRFPCRETGGPMPRLGSRYNIDAFFAPGKHGGVASEYG